MREKRHGGRTETGVRMMWSLMGKAGEKWSLMGKAGEKRSLMGKAGE
jgi:hypothetical protein